MTAPQFGSVIKRDQYDRPLIVPPEGGEPVPYTRASTLAGELNNGGGLIKWKARNAALGVARNEDIAMRIAGLAYGDRELDDLIEQAIERVDNKAAWGTAVHSFTEGAEPSPFTSTKAQPDVAAYYAELERNRLEVVGTELFVVNDELRVAGTFDHVYRHPIDGLLLGDKKTGKAKWLEVSIQLACYAGGSLYSPTTGERTPLGVRRDLGLLVHIPKEEGDAVFYSSDLILGRDLALIAARARDAKKELKGLPAYDGSVTPVAAA